MNKIKIIKKTKNNKTRNNKTRNNKTRNNKTRKYRNIKKGGLIIQGDPKNVFKKFIIFSNFNLLSDSSFFGIILEAKITDEKYSNYFNYSYNNYGTKIHSILIKLVVLKKNENNEFWKCQERNKKKDYISNFKKEALIQNKIFIDTSKYLEPICPAIVHYDILGKNSSLDFLNIINKNKNTNTNLKNILNDMTKLYNSNSDDYLGLIAMEIADGYEPLHKYKYNDNFELYKSMAKLQLFKMFKCSYFHNDFHLGNILFNPSYQGMYNNIPGKALIIDFGFSAGITNEIAKSLIDNDQIQETFNYIYTKLSRPDLYKFNNSRNYSWIYEEDVENNNNYMNELLTKEEEIIDIKNKNPHQLNFYLNNLKNSSYIFENINPKDSEIVQPNNDKYFFPINNFF